MPRGLTSPQNTFLDTIATRFDGTHSNFVLGNAQSRDNPIVYCSDGFVELTGFTRVHIMSKSCSCSFLWGRDTDNNVTDEIMDCLAQKSELKTQVLFYRKDGTSFMCLLDIVPIKNEKDQVVLFLVSHKNLSESEQASQETDDIEAGYGDEDRSEEDGSDDKEGHHNSAMTDQYKRRRSRAVLYQLSGQYKKKKSRFKCFNFRPNFGGHKNQVPEYKVNESRGARRFIVLHYSLFKIIWDWLILVCTFYIAIFVPYNVAFLRDRKFLYFDIVVEALFFIDMIMNFRTTYVSKAGQVVYCPWAIARNYVTGWFILDLIAAIPFDAFSNVETNFGGFRYEIQMMKLSRLLRLIRLIQKIERYAQYSFVLLALLICAFALCAHWMACIWYLIGRNELNNNTTRTINWLYDLSEKIGGNHATINWTQFNNTVDEDRNIMNITIRSIYISSLYFTCTTITSVGFGNVAPNTDSEKIFSICTMLVGALMHAAIFGNVTAIIQRMYSRKTNYQTRNQDLKDFTKVHHVPKPLKQRMFEFFQTNWAINRGIDPQEILKDFPEEMRGEISLHLNKEMMSLELFEGASNSCKKSLAQQIKTQFATPGEFLLHRGDAIKYLYLMCSGSIEILDTQESVVALLGKFDLFGPEKVYQRTRSNFEVRALTYCELQCLNLDCLDILFEQYPEFKLHFVASISEELSFNVSEVPLSNQQIVNQQQSFNMENKYVQESPEYIYLPAICEKEEDLRSDDNDDKVDEDKENENVHNNNDPFDEDDALFHSNTKPSEFRKQHSFNYRRQSFQQQSTMKSCFKRPRSASLPIPTKFIPTNNQSESLSNQLHNLSNSSSQLCVQLTNIQQCVDHLTNQLNHLNLCLQNHPSISSSSSSIFIQSPPPPAVQLSASPQRVKFDLKPTQIQPTTSNNNFFHNHHDYDDGYDDIDDINPPSHSNQSLLNKLMRTTTNSKNDSNNIKRISSIKQNKNSKTTYSILNKRSSLSSNSFSHNNEQCC